MKTIFRLILYLSVFVFSSCGHNHDYIEAVNENDYVEAHEILSNLYGEYSDAYAELTPDRDEKADRFWNAALYIYKAEMMYLVQQHDESANMRLLINLSQINPVGIRPTPGEFVWDHNPDGTYAAFLRKFNGVCDEVLNVSFLFNNEDMARKVLKIYKDEWDNEKFNFTDARRQEVLKKIEAEFAN